MIVLGWIVLGIIVGAIAVCAHDDPKIVALEELLDNAREELADVTAERDAFAMHLDDVIDCSLGETALDRARRMHPAGGRYGTWDQSDRPALHIVGRA